MAEQRKDKRVQIPVPVNGIDSISDELSIPEGFSPALDYRVSGGLTSRYRLASIQNLESETFGGLNTRKGFYPYNSNVMTLTVGTVTNITSNASGVKSIVSFATGITLSGVASGGYVIKLNPGTSYYQISALLSNAQVSLQQAWTDTVVSGSCSISPNGIDGIFEYETPTTTQSLMAFSGGRLWKASVAYTGAASFTDLAVALTKDKNYSAVTYLNNFIFCNGYQFSYYDGTSVASMTGSPSPADPKYLAVYSIGTASYLAIAGSNTTADKSRVSFYALNSVTSQPSTHRYLVGDRDGGQISGLAVIPGGLMVFKTNGVFIMNGIPGSSISLRKVSDIGCLASKSITTRGSAVYFLGTQNGRNRVFRYAGGNTLEAISQQMDYIFNDSNYFLDRDSLERDVSGCLYKNKYFLSTISSGSFFCYTDRPTNPWFNSSREWRFAQAVMPSASNSLSLYYETMISGSTVNGFIYFEDYGHTDSITDNLYNTTSSITFKFLMRYYDFGDISRKKQFYDLYYRVDTYGYSTLNLSLDCYLDQVNSVSASPNATFNLTSSTLTAPVSTDYIGQVVFTPLLGRSLKMSWSGVISNGFMTFYPQAITYKMDADYV